MVNYVLFKTSVELVDDEYLGVMLVLYHEYDNDYLMLKGMSAENLSEIQRYVLQESEKIYKDTVSKIDDTNMYCIGKISLQSNIAGNLT